MNRQELIDKFMENDGHGMVEFTDLPGLSHFADYFSESENILVTHSLSGEEFFIKDFSKIEWVEDPDKKLFEKITRTLNKEEICELCRILDDGGDRLHDYAGELAQKIAPEYFSESEDKPIISGSILFED